MTREHKLALIVGFALLLLVGVLISDHLSAARSSRIDTVAPEQLAQLEPPIREAPIDPLGRITGSDIVQPRVAGMHETSTPTTNPGSSSAPGSLSQAIQRAEIQPKVVEPLLGGNDPLQESVVANGGRILPGADGTGVIELVSGRSEAPPASVTQVPDLASVERETPAGADRTHKVKKNETLFAIAKQYYGSGRYWIRLAEYNKLGKGGEVREGAVIRIPPATAVTGKPGSAPPPSGPVAPSPRTMAADTRIAKASTYTVRDGDTLGEIARKMLGTSRRWPELVRVNKIDDEDRLVVGMVLRVPQP